MKKTTKRFPRENVLFCEYRTIGFSGICEKLDKKLQKIVGSEADGSFSGGKRELHWHFKTKKEALATAKKIKAHNLSVKTYVEQIVIKYDPF